MQKKPDTFIQIDFIFIIYASLLIFVGFLKLFNMLTNEFFKLNTNTNLWTVKTNDKNKPPHASGGKSR